MLNVFDYVFLTIYIFLNLFLSLIVMLLLSRSFFHLMRTLKIPFTLMTCCKNQIYFKITYKVEVAGFGPQKYFMLFKRIISACISEWASFQKQALVFFKHCQNLSRMHVIRICILWFSKKPQAELNALIRVLPNASYS